MAPERSRPERSSPDSFLPVKSAGWRDVAEAMAASTSARVISAEAISGEVRSTCSIMPCPAAGTPDASANIPIAPMIQIDACIVVSLISLTVVPSGTDGKRPNLLSSLRATGVATAATNGFTAVTEQRRGACAARLVDDDTVSATVHAWPTHQRTRKMTFLRGARRLGLALVAAAAA